MKIRCALGSVSLLFALISSVSCSSSPADSDHDAQVSNCADVGPCDVVMCETNTDVRAEATDAAAALDDAAEEKIEYSVAEFGLLPDSDPNSSPEKNLQAMKRITKELLIGARGIVLSFAKDAVYTTKLKFDDGGGAYANDLLLLEDAKDVIIEGNGARLKFRDADWKKKANVYENAYIRLDNSERVVIRNLAMGCDWDDKPLAVIGKVDKFNPETKEVFYQVVSRGNLNKDNQVIRTTFLGWDPEVKARSVRGVNSNVKEVEIVGPKRLKAVFEKKFDESIIGKYSYIPIEHRTAYSGIMLEGNDYVLIDNVKFLGIPYLAVHGRNRRVTHHQIIRNCTLKPQEQDTYFAAEEGFDVRSRWYVFENNYVEYCYDDVMNFDAGVLGAFLGGGLEMSKAVIGGKEREVITAKRLEKSFAKDVIVPGRVFGLADDQFKPTGWTSKLLFHEWKMNVHPGKSAPHSCVLAFEKKLPDNVPENYILYSPYPDQDGSYIIRNNTIRRSLRHAIWAGNGNGLIENNTIEYTAFPAIMLQMTRRWSYWYKGYYPSNVIIRGNTIRDSSMMLFQPAALFVGGGNDTAFDGYFPIDNYVTSNVLIEDNVIENSYQAALGVWSSENIIIRNNTIRSPFMEPLAPTCQGNGAVFVKKSRNVTLEGNKMTYQRPTDRPAKFVSEGNINVTMQNNAGFE